MRSVCIAALALVLAACTPSISGVEGGGTFETLSETVSTSPGASTPGAPAEVVGGDEAALRAFIGRALVYHYPGAPERTHVLVGSLPSDLPVNLPLPPGSVVIGSIVQENPDSVEVILDAEPPAEAVADFYRRELTAAGWETPPAQVGGPGFVSDSFPTDLFCLNGHEAILNLNVAEIEGPKVEARLTLQLSPPYSPCEMQAQNARLDEGTGLIPSLKSPSGSLIQSGSSGSGQGEASISATIVTDLTASELAQSYAAQLAGDGWRRLEQGSGQGYAWSAWAREDDDGDPWQGLLLVLEVTSASDRRYAWFQIEAVK